MTNIPNHPTNTPPPPHTHPPTSTPTITVAHQDTTQSSAANRPIHSPPSTTHTNACAACRFQRRKCTETCPLAPYFPAHNQQQFMNAYKLFGVNNIIKALNSVPPNCRDDAMTALIYTSNVRAHDPVLGCTRIIESLNSQIAFYNDQLMAVLAEIAAFRAAAHLDGPPPFLGSQVQVVEALPLLSSAYFSEGVRDSECKQPSNISNKKQAQQQSEGVGDSECKQPSIISNKKQAQQQRRLRENLLQDDQTITDLIKEVETANQLKLKNTYVLQLENKDVQVQNVASKIKLEYTSDENPEPKIAKHKPTKRKPGDRFEEPKNIRNRFNAFGF